MAEDRIIDIYWGNKSVDLAFASVNGIKAVICKATEGTLLPANARDAQMYPKWKVEARRKNLLWGAYHLTNGASPAEQLAHFLSIEDGSDETIAMAIDWETAKDGTSLDLQGLRELVKLFVKRFNGRFPLLYGGSKIRDHAAELNGDPILGACPLWYQQYSRRPRALPANAVPLHFPVGAWDQYALWQYSDEHASLYGAPDFRELEGADWNRFSGTGVELAERWPFKGMLPNWRYVVGIIKGEDLLPVNENGSADAFESAATIERQAAVSKLPLGPIFSAATAPVYLAQALESPTVTRIESLSVEAAAQAHALGNMSFEQRSAAHPGALIGVAEGDSWFDYLPAYFEDIVRGDLLGHLNHSGHFNIYKVAKAGDTLENMAYGTDLGSNYERRPPELLTPLDAV